MNFNQIHTVYFIGIGGIGMSAIARYFNSQGKRVIGYDKTETTLTKNLVAEGIEVHYHDMGVDVLTGLDKSNTLVVYTPAIPVSLGELLVFQENNFTLIKRAKALGIISSEFETYAVAGTHGKTTTCAILAHVLYQTKEKCNAFIGGITSNYNSNCIIDASAKRVVVEADEFDRSFLQLKPNYAIITTMDSDHLDIYGDGEHLQQSFNDFIELVNVNGHVWLQSDLDVSNFKLNKALKISTYGFSDQADWEGGNLKYESGHFYFDIKNGEKQYNSVEFGLPGKHNAENALSVFALCMTNGVDEQVIRDAFKSFKGVKRRFDFHIRREDLVVIDDYAHHPTEITAFLSSVKTIYPDKKLTTVFQPHLFSRTRDFMGDFARALELTDELFLLDIYPAREQPIPGITSSVLLEKINLKNKRISTKLNIVEDLNQTKKELIVIVGAGDIDTCIQPIVNHYKK
ncbi:MAG: UDP-N-acetylmuramate--alanine ligase [Crocinitomix sp.]